MNSKPLKQTNEMLLMLVRLGIRNFRIVGFLAVVTILNRIPLFELGYVNPSPEWIVGYSSVIQK
jgi:hypothetical protein